MGGVAPSSKVEFYLLDLLFMLVPKCSCFLIYACIYAHCIGHAYSSANIKELKRIDFSLLIYAYFHRSFGKRKKQASYIKHYIYTLVSHFLVSIWHLCFSHIGFFPPSKMRSSVAFAERQVYDCVFVPLQCTSCAEVCRLSVSGNGAREGLVLRPFSWP